MHASIDQTYNIYIQSVYAFALAPVHAINPMQISRSYMDELLLLWPESMGTQPWLTMWRRSSLDLEVSWPSAAVYRVYIVNIGIYSELHSQQGHN